MRGPRYAGPFFAWWRARAYLMCGIEHCYTRTDVTGGARARQGSVLSWGGRASPLSEESPVVVTRRAIALARRALERRPIQDGEVAAAVANDALLL